MTFTEMLQILEGILLLPLSVMIDLPWDFLTMHLKKRDKNVGLGLI